MSSFEKNKRERFLNEATYKAFTVGTREEIEFDEELLTNDLSTHAHPDRAFTQWTASLSNGYFEQLVGRYSAGEPIDEIAPTFPKVINAVEMTALPHPIYKSNRYFLDEIDAYHRIMALLSLAKLLRYDYLVPRVATLIDVEADENRGIDALYETLIDKLGLPSEPAPKVVAMLKAHPILLEVTQAPPDKQPKLMAQFLKKWYSSMRGCYWHNRHKRVPQHFSGYWAFESGLVTYLWDIDDSSYRDLPFYPKDLVDYARTHDAVPEPERGIDQSTMPQRPNIPAGQPCPETGWWFSPAKAESRRYFKAGDVMPSVDSDYGETFWQWAPDQSPPKL